MNGNLSVEIGEAMERVERGTSGLANAKRRLSRAEQAVVTARADVVSAEEELKTASASLETMILRNIKTTMRKGGSKMVVAIGDILSRSLDGDQVGAADQGGIEPVTGSREGVNADEGSGESGRAPGAMAG